MVTEKGLLNEAAHFHFAVDRAAGSFQPREVR